MKFVATIILTLFLSDTSFGQKFPQTLVDSLCNVTIEYYYTDFAKPLDSVEALSYKPSNAFILKSELTPNLQTKFKDFTVLYVTQREALEEFVKTKNRTGSLEKLFVTQLQDTINIDIGGWAVRVTKVKYKNGKAIPVNSNFAASCGGTLGYIPTCRFVFDRTTNSWTRHTWQETADAIMKARQRADDE
ncbi:MAG: hypothetical protein LCH58_13005 [Bacteroidetes bacterium]|uniref:hypothetical protein n=1 Tax=Phnomibacter sp. TaxID=2836217 RepID=UPI002FDCFB0C|nr:hypothetical protein [Bacteroidota bacterium]